MRESALLDEISVNQFIAAAVSEKMALNHIKLEAAKGNSSDFDYFLSLVPNVSAMAGDEMHGVQLAFE